MLGLPKLGELTTLQVCEISAVMLAVLSVGMLIFALSATITAARSHRPRRQCPRCQKAEAEKKKGVACT